MLDKLVLVASLAICLLATGCKKSADEKDPAATDVATKVESATEATPTEVEPAPETTTDDAEGSVNDAEDSAVVIKNPFFYTVTGPNGESGFLLGTMHMGVDAAKEMPKDVWLALASASSLTIEADITDVTVAMGLMLPKDQNLKDLLGEESWALLEKKVGKPTAQMLLPMKPAAAASAIAIQGIKMTMPMDLAVVAKAQTAELPIHYLEDAAFQLAMLEKVMTVETVREMLASEDATDMKTMLETYRKGDAEALLEEMQDTSSLGENGEEKIEALLFDRNANWIPKLEELFAEKGAFVAVGAAHLIGPRSVNALLKAKGYTITRMGE
tara:strand:- start:58935 stop:59918 length:984 start_codon:yes stop_codon:yes gene_type:complete